MGRNYEVFAILKPDLTADQLVFINQVLSDAMFRFKIKSDHDTFYHLSRKQTWCK